MLKSYVTVALRALRKRPGYAFINIAGLGLGLACFALIMLFVREELSYDRHHEDADRIHRVAFIGYPPGSEPDRFAATSAPIGRVLRAEFPEIESLVRINPFTASVTLETEKFFDQPFWYAESDLFDVFTLPVVAGPRQGLLEAPRTMVLTETAAERVFGSRDPVGRTVMMNDTTAVTVQAVIEDFPSASHFETDFILSYATLLETQPEGEGWLSIGLYTYVKLNPQADPDAFQAKISGLVNERFAEVMQQIGFDSELVLEPLTEIYLKSDLRAQIGPLGDMTQVWVFSAIAVFVLLLACINFTNLATARSMERAREVGVRKVAGSSRQALVGQFLSESVVLALFSLVIAAGLMVAALPLLNAMAGKELAWAGLFTAPRIAMLFGIAVLCGLLGGLYPAVVMSAMQSVSVLKGSFHSTRRGALLRKSLVAVQFAISIGLIAGTVMVKRQLDYMRSRDLGFDQERVLVVDTPAFPRENRAGAIATMKAEFETIPGVLSASMTSTVPGRGTGRNLFSAEGFPEDDIKSAVSAFVGTDYFENMGIELLAGRHFSPDFPSDPQEAAIINRATVEYLSWGTPEEAVGKTVDLGGGPRAVVGVVADYHHQSLKEVIEPMIFITNPVATGYLSLRLAPGDPAVAIAEAETRFARMYPNTPFEYFFLDQDYNRQYQSEERLMRLAGVFSLLAIVIACLGLVGLAAFTAQQRTKEVGVRKVLGASTAGLMALLSREFSILVAVGFLLAIPVTSWGMHRWLSAFPYHIGVDVLSFVIAGAGAMLIALASVSWQAMRVATADPVQSLRYE